MSTATLESGVARMVEQSAKTSPTDVLGLLNLPPTRSLPLRRSPGYWSASACTRLTRKRRIVIVCNEGYSSSLAACSR